MSNPNNPYGSQPEQNYGGQQPYGQPQQYGQPPMAYGGQPVYSVPVAGNYAYATLGSRVAAYLVDNFIIGLPVVVVSLLLGGLSGVVNVFVDLMTALVMPFLYHWYYWVKKDGQTIGHKMMGIRVVREQGGPITTGTAVLRYLGYLINGPVLALGWLWPLWDDKLQGWHDKMAGTVVVRS